MPASVTVLSPNRRTPHKPTPNPNSPSYFGLAVTGGATLSQSTGPRLAKTDGQTSATNNMRSAGASPLHTLPFHNTPDYEAFRHQVESNAFSLNQASVPKQSSTGFPLGASLNTNINKSTESPSTPKSANIPLTGHPSSAASSLETSPFSSRSLNKRGLSSSDVPTFHERSGRRSQAPFSAIDSSRDGGSPPLRHEEKCPRLSLPHDDIPKPRVTVPQIPRFETLPEKLDIDGPTMVSAQHIVNILDSQADESLILDLRVSTQYDRARIANAFNLCVPTTLLKRSTYNVDKLADTVRGPAERSRFENWRQAKCIIVYDGSSSQLHEASNCLNVLKKFISEGWTGDSHIIRGGFFEFSRKFPKYIEQGTSTGKSPSPPNLTLKTDDETLAPVVGGCPMPATESAANPFFGNIRQNMDLIGGVGQIPVRAPASLNDKRRLNLPTWLRNIADEKDGGRTASEKFLQIEKREQKRMQEALSGAVEYGSGGEQASKAIKIAGIEQGSKNRYNNIWPFEHSRVKLQGIPAHGCDYINANFVQTTLSSKKYIATQGPIPATFDDFWNMVWQQDIRVIVMLTAETEGGQIKAHNYWSERKYGPLKVKFLSEHHASLESAKSSQHRKRPSLGKQRASYPSWSSPTVETTRRQATTPGGQPFTSFPASSTPSDPPFLHVRKFTLSHQSQSLEQPRQITQLQYSSWPDFGAPAHPKHLLGLVEQCESVVDTTSSSLPDQHKERPVLVHCSAGCGRTGTFCTVDTVVDILKRQQALANSRPQPLRRNSPRDTIMKDPNSMEISPDPFSSLNSRHDTNSNNNDLLRRDDIDYIEKIVEELRLQRLSMVQSLRQFVLCYETVLEWIETQKSS